MDKQSNICMTEFNVSFDSGCDRYPELTVTARFMFPNGSPSIDFNALKESVQNAMYIQAVKSDLGH